MWSGRSCLKCVASFRQTLRRNTRLSQSRQRNLQQLWSSSEKFWEERVSCGRWSLGKQGERQGRRKEKEKGRKEEGVEKGRMGVEDWVVEVEVRMQEMEWGVEEAAQQEEWEKEEME